MIQVLSDAKAISNLYGSRLSQHFSNLLCFYNSHLEAIITNPLYMNLPFNDMLVHRGYAVFDTLKVFGKSTFQLESHVNRFFESIKLIRLEPQITKSKMSKILQEITELSIKMRPNSDIDIRYFYSPGVNKFSISKSPSQKHSFYALSSVAQNELRPIKGIHEFAYDYKSLDKELKAAKTINYLRSSIIASNSQERCGYQGLLMDSNGDILEGVVSNVAFIDNKGAFITPSFDKVLAGTTVKKVLSIIEKSLIPKQIVTSIIRGYVNIKDIPDRVQEAMHIGGDFIVPIFSINGKNISSKPGKVTLLLQKMINKEKYKASKETMDLTISKRI